MALDSSVIEDIKPEVFRDLKTEDNVRKAFRSFENHFGTKMSEMDIEKYVGIILVDGMSGPEEKIMDTISNLTNVIFVGGSAGDDLKFDAAWTHSNGLAFHDSAVLALMKPAAEFDILKTQSFCLLNKL